MKLDDAMNLDVSSPDKVPAVLNLVIDRFNESANVLQADWQDKGAGAEWAVIARILTKANTQIMEYLASVGYNQFSDDGGSGNEDHKTCSGCPGCM